MGLYVLLKQVKNMFKAIIRFLRKDCFRGVFSYQTHKTGLLVIISMLLISYFYEPFGISQTNQTGRWIFITGYTFCSFIGYSATITLFSPYSKKKWTNFQEICTYFTCFLSIAILIYGYTLFCNNILFLKILKIEGAVIQSQQLFWKVIIDTFAGGFIIYHLLRMYDMLDSYKNQNTTKHSINEKHYIKKNRSSLTFIGKNKNEHITLERDTFICTKSEGHYIKIYYLCTKSYQVKYMFLRNTMIEIENQTADYSYIYRCHKSFFINLDLLNSVIGNSNRTHVYLEHFSDAIPVSKTKISYLKDMRLRKVI